MAWCHLKYFLPGIWDLDSGLRICQGVTRQVMVAFKCNSYDDDHFAKKSTNDPEVESRVINGITEADNKWDAETKPDDQGRKMMVSSVLAGDKLHSHLITNIICRIFYNSCQITELSRVHTDPWTSNWDEASLWLWWHWDVMIVTLLQHCTGQIIWGLSE